jgi:hypothetical protein
LTSTRRKSAPHQRKTFYSNGELNAIIDAFMHPLAKRDPRFALLDGILHGLVERNPSESVRKFVKYDSSRLLEQIIRHHNGRKRKL